MMPSAQLTPDWTPCSPDCEHRGPYRVHYLNGENCSFLVGPEGAHAGFAFIAPPCPIYVEAPDHG